MRRPEVGVAFLLALRENVMADGGDDLRLWLEEVRGERAMAWVRAQNAVTEGRLAVGEIYRELRPRLLEAATSPARIPAVEKWGEHLYNFWKDATHVRGLWRRTTLPEYKKSEGTAWETVLDLDAVAALEGENWVWGGAAILRAKGEAPRRALVWMSRGGGDTVVVREYDLERLVWVEDGFFVPAAKSEVAWLDEDTIFAASDVGAGSMTTSGYPRTVRKWKRGTPLAEAEVVFEADVGDVSVVLAGNLDQGEWRVTMARVVTCLRYAWYLWRGAGWVRIVAPEDTGVLTAGTRLIFELRSDWEVAGNVYRAGSVLVTDMEAYLAGGREMTVLFEPGERRALASVLTTGRCVVLNTMENVASCSYLMRPVDGGGWERVEVASPGLSRVEVSGMDEGDGYWVDTQGFLLPPTLAIGDAAAGSVEELKRLPAMFDVAGMEVRQWEAVSADGTRVPYFEVGRRGRAIDGGNATILYGYGGYQIPMQPWYSVGMGRGWLERGGTLVVANIRGGGEFGPAWHQAAKREHRQRAFDDFAAVAEDLQRRGVTSPKKLGIMGGSNGGLLVGVMLTQRPELFGAVVMHVPLCDMERYTLLTAGPSWVDEYGDPGTAEGWGYLSRYSPYHCVRAGVKYPPVLITTSTLDDRVHPGHARRMAARLEAAGHSVFYFENAEGGHAMTANFEQWAHVTGMEFAFLWETLGRWHLRAAEK